MLLELYTRYVENKYVLQKRTFKVYKIFSKYFIESYYALNYFN